MNLKNAVEAVAPVVGDGRLIPTYAYVLCREGVLHATDGNQWAEVAVDMGETTFCVRYELLRKALARDYLTLWSDDANGLVVSYGRGKARLKGIDPSAFPVADKPRTEFYVALPPEFKNRVKDLLAFASNGDGHVWQQAVHIHGGFMFAANSFALAKCPMDWHFEGLTGVPTWACKMIVSMAKSPLYMRLRGQMISFLWEDIELFSRLLVQDAPTNILSFATAMAEPTDPVPEGLKDAVDRIVGHGGTTCRIGAGSITYGTESVELDDLVYIDTPIKTWGTATLAAALEHATALDLSEPNGRWAGEGYVGVFGGRTD